MAPPLPIDVDQQAVSQFCRKWQITELAVFGSVLRDDFCSESDVDVLITMENENSWLSLDSEAAAEELSEIFGRKTDLLTRQSLEWWRTLPSFRKRVLETAEIIYAHACIQENR